MTALPRIGCMLGDVTGIGPEITVKLLASGKAEACARVIIIGDSRVLELGMHNADVRLPYTVYKPIDEIHYARDDFALIDLANVNLHPLGCRNRMPDRCRLTSIESQNQLNFAFPRQLRPASPKGAYCWCLRAPAAGA